MNELTTTNNLVLSGDAIPRMMQLAEIMANSTFQVPAHFRGKPGDCLSVVFQAIQWGMSPFTVAQKTFLVNGVLGYESQLVNAVVSSSGAIRGTFKYEYRGDECRVGAIINGDQDITWGAWLSASKVQVKNSPLWKTNPMQQLAYLQVKNWARLYCPGAILGVYTKDELETNLQDEKEINPILPELLDKISKISSKEDQSACKKIINTLSINDKKIANEAYKSRIEFLKAELSSKVVESSQEPEIEQELNKFDEETGEVWE